MQRALPLLICLATARASIPGGSAAPPGDPFGSSQARFSEVAIAERWKGLVESGLAAWGIAVEPTFSRSRLKTTVTRMGQHLRLLMEVFSAGGEAVVFRKSYRATEATLPRLALRAVDDIARHETGRVTPASRRFVAVQDSGAGISEIVLTDGAGTALIPLTRHRSRSVTPTAIRRGRFAYVTYLSGPPQLWGMEMKTRRSFRLLEPGLVANPSFPALSPDGSTLAFLDTDKKGRQAVRLLDWASGALRDLTGFQYGLGAPAWSPDGNNIAFIDSQGAAPQLVVQPTDRNPPHRYNLQGTHLSDPAWHPTERKLAFVREQAGEWTLVMLDLETQRSSEVLRSQRTIASPRWSPAKDWLAFSDDFGVHMIHTVSRQLRDVPPAHTRLRNPRWDWESPGMPFHAPVLAK